MKKVFRGYLASKTEYQVKVLLFGDAPAHPKQKPYKGVYLMMERQYDIRAQNPFPQDLYKQLIKNNTLQKREFNRCYNILLTSEVFKEMMQNKPKSYITAIKFISVDTLEDGGREYNPLDEGLMDATNISCNFKYIETKINLEEKTFFEAIKNKTYKDNECWINSITDFYGDTLMNNKERCSN